MAGQDITPKVPST
uniref:Uncharacterized protein n=1 Tax=Arundo donax TaxID=35708 RepID=A0A0A8XUR2_ARUDO